MWTSLRGFTVITFLPLALVFAPYTQDAVARPGTPNNLRAWSPNAWSAYFFFTNTASELVGFEWELTANGRRLTEKTLDCWSGGSSRAGPVEHPACLHASYGQGAQARPSQPFRGYGSQLVAFGVNFDPETKYCFRVRTREWNDGRWWEGLVSEAWSSWVCVATGPTPNPPPSPSQPRLTYFPTVARSGGELSDELLVEWNGSLEDPKAGFEIQWLNPSWTPFCCPTLTRHVFRRVGQPSPQHPLTLRVCNVNRFGRSCSPANSAYQSVAVREPGLREQHVVGKSPMAAGPGNISLAKPQPGGIPDRELIAAVTEVLKRDLPAIQPRIQVSAANGVVTLAGTVPSVADRTAAETSAKGIVGVKGIQNNLQTQKLAQPGNVTIPRIPTR